MPQPVNYTVRADQIKRGDSFTDGTKVLGVNVKTKYTYVTIDLEPTPLRLVSDGPVVVQRFEPTADEKAAQAREMLNTSRRRFTEKMLALTDETLLEAETARVKYCKFPAHYSCSSFDLDTMLKAEARARLVGVFSVQLRELGADWAAVETVSKELMDTCVTRVMSHARGTTSRSTSSASNMIEDYDAQAAAWFVQLLNYSYTEFSFSVPRVY